MTMMMLIAIWVHVPFLQQTCDPEDLKAESYNLKVLVNN